MRYFECLVDSYLSFGKGVIYPEKTISVNGDNVLFFATNEGFKVHWKEVTEAEYLEQQDLLDEFDRHVEGGMKAIQGRVNIHEYHAALEAIGQGRIKEIPQHIFDAILKELVDEDKRRWALENGFVESSAIPYDSLSDGFKKAIDR